MNKDMYSRIRTAAEYQKKAIRALFPQKVSRHLDVIEKELKLMAAEAASDIIRKRKKEDTSLETQESDRAFQVKKVNIL